MPQLPMDGNLKHIYVPKIDIIMVSFLLCLGSFKWDCKINAQQRIMCKQWGPLVLVLAGPSMTAPVAMLVP